MVTEWLISSAHAADAVAAPLAAQDISLAGLIWQADIVVKLVMLSLVVASFWSWTIIFEKWKLMRRINHRSDKFEALFGSGMSLDQIMTRTKGKSDTPMAVIFHSAMREWKDGILKNVTHPAESVKHHAFRQVEQTMHTVKHKAVEKLETRLIFLATVAASSPFIGLFGTVWGIMNSFQSIAASKNTTLAVVAPGIAEALLATGIGLFAAIPAVIFYNMFSNEIRRYANRLEDFAGYLATAIAYQIEHGKAGEKK